MQNSLKEKKLLHYGHDRVTDKRFTPSQETTKKYWTRYINYNENNVSFLKRLWTTGNNGQLLLKLRR